MMKSLLILLVLFTFLAGPVSADKYAAEFLKIGAGARALGMGGGFTALADDASAAYWNPAGLVFLDNSELLLMHAEFLGALANYDYGGFAQPMEQGVKRSALGVSVARFAVDDIQITRDAYDDANGNGRYDEGEEIRPDLFYRDSDTEYALFMTYATTFRPSLLIGGNVKLIRQDLVGTKSFGIGCDLGLLYIATPSLRLGARLADITTTQISWDTGRKEVVSPSVTLGMAYSREIGMLNGVITGALDLATTFENRREESQFSAQSMGFDLLGGVEYWYRKTIAVRTGLNAGTFTAGGGIRYRGFGADYAFIPNKDLDDTHRISGSVSF